MLKSEVQHQFWITKKAVQRKLGSKEDKHIISSDAELDAKIEVFKSIAETSADLSKIIDQYQERLCILSQEECVFGRFLKEAGKRSKTTGTSITNTGKAMSYAGQQRMCVRVPLLRLQHEVDVFRCRAVKDTENTLHIMEKERTEYRAALSWMKSASTELDPDTGKGLEKFRTAQTHVRAAKHNFDSFSLDSIQKIDLLAAARCNMYSHALLTYVNELKQFAQKAASTFETISKSLSLKPKYDFCVLKELTQNEGEQPNTKNDESIKPIQALDKDQSLFFATEYRDENGPNQMQKNTQKTAVAGVANEEHNEALLIELSKQIDEISNCLLDTQDESAVENTNESATTTNNFWSRMFNQQHQQQQQLQQPAAQTTAKHLKNINESNTSNHENTKKTQPQALATSGNQTQKPSKSNNPWLELFADLDPLANPQAFDLKLSGGRTNSQQT